MTARALKQSLASLVGQGEGYKPMGALPAVGGRPGGVSTGRPAGAAGMGAGQIVFAESDAALREYWPKQTYTSSDGLFVIEAEPVKLIYMEDGSVASFKEPPA